MDDLSTYIVEKNWPQGFKEAIVDSKLYFAQRFVIVDNSRSMLKCDGHRLLNKGGGERFVL